MASRASIVEGRMQAYGKSSAEARAKIDAKVGMITVDLLTQNQGRFTGLQKSQNISIVSGTRRYKLNADFNTARETFNELDSDGNPDSECRVINKAQLLKRLRQGRYSGVRLAWIEEDKDGADGPGKYLVLGADPTESTTYEFDYYRKPTENDTELISNTYILETGVDANMPEFDPQADYKLTIYLKMRDGFREDPELTQPNLHFTPCDRAIRHNKRMHDIGGGG